MNFARPLRHLLPVTMIAAAIVLSSWILARSLVRVKSGEELIRVVGSARKPIRSDFIIWNCTVTQNAADLKTAYAQLQINVTKVKSYLVGKGVAEKEISPAAIDSKTISIKTKLSGATPADYARGTGSESAGFYEKVVGYRLSQDIEVRSEKVDRVDAISRQSTELISSLPFSSSAPQYLYTKMSDLKVAMQAQAAKDAYDRAEQIALKSNSQLGPLRFARMQVPQITPLFSSEESDGGTDDTSSMDKKITAIVVAGYSIR